MLNMQIQNWVSWVLSNVYGDRSPSKEKQTPLHLGRQDFCRQGIGPSSSRFFQWIGDICEEAASHHDICEEAASHPDISEPCLSFLSRPTSTVKLFTVGRSSVCFMWFRLTLDQYGVCLGSPTHSTKPSSLRFSICHSLHSYLIAKHITLRDFDQRPDTSAQCISLEQMDTATFSWSCTHYGLVGNRNLSHKIWFLKNRFLYLSFQLNIHQYASTKLAHFKLLFISS